MTTRTKSDDSAFPTGPHNGNHEISMRDYFATSALQGLLSAMQSTAGATEEDMAISFAAVSYVIADAMIRERTSPTPNTKIAKFIVAPAKPGVKS